MWQFAYLLLPKLKTSDSSAPPVRPHASQQCPPPEASQQCAPQCAPPVRPLSQK